MAVGGAFLSPRTFLGMRHAPPAALRANRRRLGASCAEVEVRVSPAYAAWRAERPGSLRLGRGGIRDVGGVDVAQIGELADERDILVFVHLDAAEHDGAVARVDLGREHGRVEARGDKADAREDDARGNEPARHGEVDLLRAGHGTHSFLRREVRGSAALLALALPEGRGGFPRPERREARNLF